MSSPDLEELRSLVPGGTAREGLDADAVDGLVPSLVARPGRAEEVAAVLRLADRRGWAVVPRGGGTKMAWGEPRRRCNLVLDTRGLADLVEHEPGDLTCVVGAGMTLGRLQETVGSATGHSQRLMLDPPQGAGSTLGGLVATGAAGPLRQRYGTMRDLLLGARFALTDGTLARTGGKVVKNVAGYDLDKLLVGSLGTLGVVVEVSLRLHPVPASSRTVSLDGADPGEVQDLLGRLRRAPAAPSLVEVLWPERRCLIRVDSSEEGALRQAERIVGLDPRCRLLEDEEANRRLAEIATRPWDGDGVVVGFGIPLTSTAALLGLGERAGAVVSLRGNLGAGEARLGPDGVEVLREGLEKLGGHLTIHRRPGGWRGQGSRVRDRVAVDLMGRIRSQMDPAGVLAAGGGPVVS